jgi:adenylosuccinate lyase
VLLALVEAGLARDDAYRIVQRAAAAAWDDGASFRERITADPDVRAVLDEVAIASLFDPARFLRNLGPVFERLEKLPVEDVQ